MPFPLSGGLYRVVSPDGETIVRQRVPDWAIGHYLLTAANESRFFDKLRTGEHSTSRFNAEIRGEIGFIL